MAWNEGYVTEINYTTGYYRELSPSFLACCLLNRNLHNRLPQGGRYLELGFGQGLSLNLHAAAHDAEFWGVDFNPAHASHAQQLANASGANLNISDNSFEELADKIDQGKLPQFDMITLHGVWSWISNLNRAALVRILRRSLKPGGVVYLSYNANPGWSAAMPLRHLLTLHSEHAGQGPLLQRIDQALGFAQQLAEQKAGYFQQHPEVVQRLQQLKEQDRNYLAHEYFNADWQPMAFSEVARWLDDAKLQFQASAHPHSQFDFLQLPASCMPLLQQINDPILRESVRDYLCNNQFRRDIFVRGGRVGSQGQHLAAMRQQWLVLLSRPEEIPLQLQFGGQEHNLRPAMYQPVIQALDAAGGPIRFDMLEQQLVGHDINAAQLWQVLFVLIGMGHLSPAQAPEQSAPLATRCRRLNRHLIEQALQGVVYGQLISPVTGGGIAVGPLQAVFLLALSEGKRNASEIAQHSLSLFAQHNQQINFGGVNAQQPQQLASRMQQEVELFLQRRWPVLQWLDVSL